MGELGHVRRLLAKVMPTHNSLQVAKSREIEGNANRILAGSLGSSRNYMEPDGGRSGFALGQASAQNTCHLMTKVQGTIPRQGKYPRSALQRSDR